MPELPEVETIRRDLEAKLVGQKIIDLKILSPKTVVLAPAVFYKKLVGQKIAAVQRRAKLLIIKLAPSNKYLLVHLKMTGQLIYKTKQGLVVGGHSLSDNNLAELPNKHTRVYFIFSDSGQLFFNDLRKFGYLKLVTKIELEKIIKNNYGPEPLTPEFTLVNLSQILKGKKTNIKAALLNQKNIAGLGNIYVDEVLFAAEISPKRQSGSLKEAELKLLHRVINTIISSAIANRGTTFNNYVDADGRKGNHSQYLKVYGRAGKKCLRCRSLISKTKLVGRGTNYCPVCQV